MQHFWLVSVAAGVLLGVGLIVSALWWFSVLGMTLVLFGIQQAADWRRASKFGFWVWAVKTLVVFSWVWDTYPLDWTGGASPLAQVALISFFWCFTAVLLGFGGGVFGYLAWNIRRLTLLQQFDWILVPCVWVIGEWVGSLVFLLGFAGPGVAITPYFSFGFIGYALAATSFGIWLAGFGGVTVLSCGMVVLGLVLYRICRRIVKDKCTWYLGFVAAIIAVVGWLPCTFSYTGRATTVATVTTQFTSPLYVTDAGAAARRAALSNAVTAAVAAAPTYVVLPEDSRFLQIMYPDQSVEQSAGAFRFTHGGATTTLIDSSEMVQLPDGSQVVRVTILDGVGGQTYQFDKQYLIPIGEYVPYVLQYLMRIFGYGDALATYQKNNSYQPGPFVQTDRTPTYLPGIVFCFEEVMGGAFAKTAAVRPTPFYIHSISHSWIHPSRILEQQLDIMLQVRSRVTQVPIVTAANMTESKLYLPNGHREYGTFVTGGQLWQLHMFTF